MTLTLHSNARRLPLFAHVRLAVAAAAALVLLAATPAMADELLGDGFGSTDMKVTEKHMAPALGKGESAVERFVFEATFPDGRGIYWSTRLTNLGLGDGKASSKARVTGKGVGSKHRNNVTKKEGDYVATASPVRLAVGDNEMSGTLDAIRVRSKGETFEFDLVFESQVPAWRPGDGRVDFRNGTFFDTTILVPRGVVKGTLTVDGKTEQVVGYGYGYHDNSTISPHEQAKRWVRTRVLDAGDSFIHLNSFTLPDKLGGKTVSWMLVGKGKKTAGFTDLSVDVTDLESDAKSEQGYQVPRSMVVTGSSGGKSVTLAVKAAGKYRRTDELAKLSSVERAVASRFAHPVRYSHSGKWLLKVKGVAGVDGSGRGARFEITHLNPN
ncbi:MAG: hypothetical protein R3F39_09490 [Myxococcota bacterium]